MSALTKAQIAALQEVADGRVTRVYSNTGNVIKGTSPKTLWSLDRLGLIGDAARSGGIHVVKQVLTVKGYNALKGVGGFQ